MSEKTVNPNQSREADQIITEISRMLKDDFERVRNQARSPNVKGEGYEVFLSEYLQLYLSSFFNFHKRVKIVDARARLSALATPIYTKTLLGTLIALLGIPLFNHRITNEEKMLTQQYPHQYPEYIKTTSKLIPHIY